jgi:hypothetical protein
MPRGITLRESPSRCDQGRSAAGRWRWLAWPAMAGFQLVAAGRAQTPASVYRLTTSARLLVLAPQALGVQPAWCGDGARQE